MACTALCLRATKFDISSKPRNSWHSVLTYLSYEYDRPLLRQGSARWHGGWRSATAVGHSVCTTMSGPSPPPALRPPRFTPPRGAAWRGGARRRERLRRGESLLPFLFLSPPRWARSARSVEVVATFAHNPLYARPTLSLRAVPPRPSALSGPSIRQGPSGPPARWRRWRPLKREQERCTRRAGVM